MSAIQDTYLRYKPAGDQYVGRVISGLPLYSTQFAILPPEVEVNCQDGNNVSMKKKDIVDIMFPELPSFLNSVAIHLSSSIIFHPDF